MFLYISIYEIAKYYTIYEYIHIKRYRRAAAEREGEREAS
jgi:hypothetical protein